MILRKIIGLILMVTAAELEAQNSFGLSGDLFNMGYNFDTDERTTGYAIEGFYRKSLNPVVNYRIGIQLLSFSDIDGPQMILPACVGCIDYEIPSYVIRRFRKISVTAIFERDLEVISKPDPRFKAYLFAGVEAGLFLPLQITNVYDDYRITGISEPNYTDPEGYEPYLLAGLRMSSKLTSRIAIEYGVIGRLSPFTPWVRQNSIGIQAGINYTD